MTCHPFRVCTTEKIDTANENSQLILYKWSQVKYLEHECGECVSFVFLLPRTTEMIWFYLKKGGMPIPWSCLADLNKVWYSTMPWVKDILNIGGKSYRGSSTETSNFSGFHDNGGKNYPIFTCTFISFHPACRLDAWSLLARRGIIIWFFLLSDSWYYFWINLDKFQNLENCTKTILKSNLKTRRSAIWPNRSLRSAVRLYQRLNLVLPSFLSGKSPVRWRTWSFHFHRYRRNNSAAFQDISVTSVKRWRGAHCLLFTFWSLLTC